MTEPARDQLAALRLAQEDAQAAEARVNRCKLAVREAEHALVLAEALRDRHRQEVEELRAKMGGTAAAPVSAAEPPGVLPPDPHAAARGGTEPSDTCGPCRDGRHERCYAPCACAARNHRPEPKETEVRVAGAPGSCRAVFHAPGEMIHRVCVLPRAHQGEHQGPVRRDADG